MNISVVFADYCKIENFMNIYAKNVTNSDPKIDIWAFRGIIFEIWEGFLRGQIFDEFLIGKKSASNR